MGREGARFRQREGPSRVNSRRKADGPDVRDIVVLRDDRVKEVGTDVAVLSLDLGRKVAERDDGRLVWADENRPDEELKVVHPLGLAEGFGFR